MASDLSVRALMNRYGRRGAEYPESAARIIVHAAAMTLAGVMEEGPKLELALRRLDGVLSAALSGLPQRKK